jgi:hypothetical protein
LKPRESNTLDELLQMSLNEDVFQQILGMLEQQQNRKIAKLSKTRKTALPKRMPRPLIERRWYECLARRAVSSGRELPE